MSDFLINDRVCPQPQKWNKLWEILLSKSKEKILAPLILAAWWVTSDNEKLERFQYHLNMAEKLNVISEVELFLNSLNDTDWHHKGK